MNKKSHKRNGPNKSDAIRDPASEPPPRTEAAGAAPTASGGTIEVGAAPPACSGRPAITIDPEFQYQLPPLSVEEEAQLEQNLLREGCREALVVWKGFGILLDGHHRYALCHKNGLTFTVREVELADREAAFEWMKAHQDGRRNHTREGMSYVRGVSYNAQKKGHGGKRTGGAAGGQTDHMKTDEALTTRFKVSPKTILRDGRFAKAVDTLTANCGPEVRRFILTHESKLSQGTVLRLSRMDAADQRKAVRQLLESGEMPSSTGKPKSRSHPLPNDPKGLAQLLLRSWSGEEIAALRRALTRGKKQREKDADEWLP